MIRADRITRAYAAMRPEELAAIAFQFLASANEPELDAVCEAVPMEKYMGLDAEYRNRFDGLFNMAAYWAIEFWKAMALSLAATMTGASAARPEAPPDLAYGVRASSLLAALTLVCAEVGIEPAHVHSVAGFVQAPATGDGLPEPDVACVAELVEALRAVLTGDGRWHGGKVSA